MEESALRAEDLRASQDDPRLQDLIAEFREMLPGQSATAQAIDRNEPWEQIGLKAVEATSSLRISSTASWSSACARRREVRRNIVRFRKIVRDFGIQPD